MKGETLLAFIGGAIVGAAAAILFAPDSGSETRKKIKETIDKEYQNLKAKINQEETTQEAEMEPQPANTEE